MGKHYNRFKLAQHRKPHRSYAAAARSNNTSDPQRQHTLDNVQKALLTVMNELKNMKVDMAEIKQDINTRKSSQRSRSNNINITQNRNSNINVNNKGPVTNTASQARERFDRALTDKGMNPKKRVRVIDSSASEYETIQSKPVTPAVDQPPVLPTNIDPIDKKQQLLDNKFESLENAIKSIADNVASLSRENTPPPFVPEYFDEQNDDQYEYNANYDNEGFPTQEDKDLTNMDLTAIN